MKALKSHRICCGAYIREKRCHEIDIKINKGDDVSKMDIPKNLIPTLVMEGVIVKKQINSEEN